MRSFIPTSKAELVLRNITIVMSMVLLVTGIVGASVAEPATAVLLLVASTVLGAILVVAWRRDRSLVVRAREGARAPEALPVVFLKGQLASASGDTIGLRRGWLVFSAGRVDVFESGHQDPRFSFSGDDANQAEIEVVTGWRHLTVPRVRARVGAARIEIELVTFHGPFVRSAGQARVERVVGDATDAVTSSSSRWGRSK